MVYQLTIDDFIGPWGYSKQYVRGVLSNYKGKHVDVKISSYGGDLDHGLDIRQQFIDHGDVTVHLSGFCASAATVIAMGAKRVCMSRYGMFLVHKCSNFLDVWGSYNADQMQQLIDELTANKKENDKIDVVLANMYATRCKKSISEILDVLKRGRWLTAQEALDFGFIDEISEDNPESKLNVTPELRAKLNAFGLSVEGLPAAEPSVDDNSESAIARGINKLVNAMFPRKKTSHQKNNDMDKGKFNTVASLLNLDDISATDKGEVLFSPDQVEQINNRLDALASDLSEQNDEITSLKAQIDALKQTPGAETSQIEGDTGEDAQDNSFNLYNSIKSLI